MPRAAAALMLVVGLAACMVPGGVATTVPPPILLREAAPTALPLPPDLAASRLEYSGLAVWGDWIVLLPQYPDRLGNALVAARIGEIEAWLDSGGTTAIGYKRVRFDDAGLSHSIAGFEGFEAIAFRDRDAVLTIEARPRDMLGHIVRGRVIGDLDAIVLDAGSRMDIRPRAALSNMSDEALILTGDLAFTFFEANGANINTAPSARQFALMPDGTFNERRPLELPAIEYRITDCVPPDASGLFWCINYLFPGDRSKLNPARDEISAKWGTGPTHAASNGVERLIALHFDGTRFALAEAPPILIALRSDDQLRNWEGIARLGDRGFLLVTDQHPETILAFVPLAKP